jgi:nucleosome binding factor SPN SPT16 subunit
LEDLNNQRSADSSFSIQAFKRTKDPAETSTANSEFMAVVEQFQTIGVLPKDKFEGQFFAEFQDLYGPIKSKIFYGVFILIVSLSN